MKSIKFIYNYFFSHRVLSMPENSILIRVTLIKASLLSLVKGQPKYPPSYLMKGNCHVSIL